MSVFACGCDVDGVTRCDTHRDDSCHGGPLNRGECPPCWRARLMSIGTDRRATPTRTFTPSKETRGLDNG